MKTLVLTSAILCCLACTNDIGVTNGAGSTTGIGPEEAQLESILVPRCRSVCEVLAACPNAPSACDCSESIGAGPNGVSTATPTDCTCPSIAYDFEDCFSGCLGEVGGRYLNRGETCAAAGVDLINCYTGVDCNSFAQARTSGSDLCGVEAAEARCPTADDSGTTETSISIPATVAAVGGQPGFGGTSNTFVGAAGQGGATGVAVPSAVTCSDSTGSQGVSMSGSSPSANQLLCDSQYTGCSDGHSYRVYCGTSTPDLVTCYCIFDGRVQVTFEDLTLLSQVGIPNACNDIGIMSERCGWSVAATIITEQASP